MSNPFIGTEVTRQSDIDLLPVYQEYAWDFIHDCFIYDEYGKHVIVTENEALKIWIYKTLKTERYRHRAYDDAYGVELEQFIGKSANNSTTATEIKRYITEGLLVSPYITKIDSIQVTTQQNDKIALTIELTTIYGNLVTNVTV